MPTRLKPGGHLERGHETVTHSQREYVRPGANIHSNSIEGGFSLIRRVFHGVRRKHQPNHLNEFQFRCNTRKLNDGERVSRVVKAIIGRRLGYREPVENQPYFRG